MKKFLRLQLRKFVLYVLRLLTHEEILRVLTQDDYVLVEGDLVIFTIDDAYLIGEPVAQMREDGKNVVYFRLYRRAL